MAKDTFWFTHDYTAKDDDKILELRSEFGAEGYGVFWMLVETMAQNENGGVKATLIGGLSFGFGVAKDRLLGILKFSLEIGLFYEEEGFYYSRRIMKHKHTKDKFREYGKIGAQKRLKNKPPLSPPQPMTGHDITRQDINTEKNIKKNISNFPMPQDFNGLPEEKINSAIELLRITQKINISISDVDSLWNVFKVENLTGENFYQTKEKVYTHFIRWVKGQPIKPHQNSSNVIQPKIVM